MKIKVKIQRTNEEKELDINGYITIGELLNKIDVNPTTVIVTRNKEVITEDTTLQNNDQIELLSVISGG
ncbi:MoaD/ThiS family protein [Candidatus Woesearchaeota archaeon]|nr:MoaD/ThiS family protein [Candidatus Woesearchaeota archaeon]